MKKIIYTVLFGNNKLKLNEPEYINKDWSLICFTDRNINSVNWNIVKVEHNDLLKKSREIKIRCDKFLDFDVCLYIDSQFIIKCDIDNFIGKNLKNDFLLMKHNNRKCLYSEAKHCIRVKKGNKNVILKQIEQYQNEGFPKDFGLYACGIMLRKNTPEIINFMKLWYDEIYKYTYRDQISFPYILWKYPIKLDALNFKNTCKLFRR